MKNVVFWDVALWYILCEPTFRRNVSPPSSAVCSHLLTLVLRSRNFLPSEDGGDTFPRNVGSHTHTQGHNPEDGILHGYVLFRYVKSCLKTVLSGFQFGFLLTRVTMCDSNYFKPRAIPSSDRGGGGAKPTLLGFWSSD
jgi:hypothetical protein